MFYDPSKYLVQNIRLILIAYWQKSPINADVEAFRETNGLNIDLRLPLLPNFVCARREGSGEAARMRRLV